MFICTTLTFKAELGSIQVKGRRGLTLLFSDYNSNSGLMDHMTFDTDFGYLSIEVIPNPSRQGL